ncbi:DDE-type integrase/transposase/recombinase [Rheinheimera pleomorphica]|uniref:DDE-type integrase/transposase/recombinase n=1 Tax=Rheinheimera pleomorphica TaxID=2703963 RepID=UPI00141DE148|nr:DDE-type integrase/transposase/recombinase [Rheinheimera pleomorphica]
MKTQPNSQARYIFLNDPNRYEVTGSSSTQILLKSDGLTNWEFKLVDKTMFFEGIRNHQIEERFLPIAIEAKPKPYQEKAVDIYEDFMEVMYELVLQGLPYSTDKAYEQICAIVAERFPNQHKPYPKRTSLTTHFKNYLKSGCHSGSLLRKKRQSRKNSAINEDEFLQSFLLRHWPRACQSKTVKVYSFYLEEAKKLGFKGRSLSTFGRRVNEIKEQEHIFMKSNTETQIKMSRTNLSQMRVSAPFERVEGDRIHVHLQLRNTDGTVIDGTVALYFLIDCYTRCILAWTYEIGTPETLEGVITMLTIAHMTSEHNPYAGRIQELIVDNGPGFKPNELTIICNSLGTSVTRVAAYSPFKKPFVEAFNRYFRDNFLKGHIIKIETSGEIFFGVPGYAGRNKSGQPDEGSKPTCETATLTPEQFKQALCDFMDTYHHQSRQVIGGKTPHQMMTEPTQTFPALPLDYAKIRHCFHYKKREATLYETGFVRLHNQDFSSSELKLLYQNNKRRGDKKVNVTVSYNPGDATHVTVSFIEDGKVQYSCIVPNRDIELFNDKSPSFADLDALRTPKQRAYHSSSTFSGFPTPLKVNKSSKDEEDSEETSKPDTVEPPDCLDKHIDASNSAVAEKLAAKQNASLKKQQNEQKKEKKQSASDTSGLYSDKDYI